MRVLKFGGTSVGSAERMQHVADILRDVTEDKIVVLSAMSGTTNQLVALCGYLSQGNKAAAQELVMTLEQGYIKTVGELFAKEDNRKAGRTIVSNHFNFLKECTVGEYHPRIEKSILAQGELLSTNLFTQYMVSVGDKATLVDALDYMRLDDEGEPDVAFISERLGKIVSELEQTQCIITQGFICRNSFGEIDNLKRGGSDYTASLVGAGILASEIQIWTDIDGMHNNDPRVVDKTKPISKLSYDEAAELAYFGAKILHPSSILPARFHSIPVKLKNTLDPEALGTLITTTSDVGQIKAVAAKDGITAITIRSSRMLMAYGFLRAIFEVFERYKTPIDLITTSEVAVSVTIDDLSSLENIISDLRTYGVVEVESDHAIISMVGNSIGDQVGIAADVMNALKSIPLRMISFGGSKHNISLLVPSEFKAQTLKELNSQLFKL